jgi:hypothetical protein
MTTFNHSECDPTYIKEFAATISNQPLGLARYCSEVWGQPTKCFENVKRKMQQDGGRARFGWMFHYRVVADIPGPGYLIAVHHAVWHAPNGHLIDITPFHPEPRHHPLSPGGDVLFLVDDRVTPVTRERLIAPLPSRFYPLSADERLITHVQQLVREEEQECRQIYEDSQT